MKKYYYPNQYLKTRSGFNLDISTYGGVYHRDTTELHKLDSAIFPHSRILAVITPEDKTVLIRYGAVRFGKTREKGLVEL